MDKLRAREPPSPDTHIVVVGAGFAGVELTKRLKGAPVRITLIDRHNYHLFQPLLYQAATAVLAPSEIAWPIREMFRDRDDVEVVLDVVAAVDRTAKRVSLGAFSVAAELASGTLVPLLEEFNPGDVELIHAVFVGGTNIPARVRVFVDFLIENLR